MKIEYEQKKSIKISLNVKISVFGLWPDFDYSNPTVDLTKLK